VINAEYGEYIRAETAFRAQQEEAERELQREQVEAALQRQKERAADEARRQIYVAELARRAQVAANLLRTNIDRLECLYPSLQTCDHFELTVTVKNASKEIVTSFMLGWTFISEGTPICPSSIPGKQRQDIRLRPNDTTVLNIKGYDGPKSTNSRVCVGIASSEISP